MLVEEGVAVGVSVAEVRAAVPVGVEGCSPRVPRQRFERVREAVAVTVEVLAVRDAIPVSVRTASCGVALLHVEEPVAVRVPVGLQVRPRRGQVGAPVGSCVPMGSARRGTGARHEEGEEDETMQHAPSVRSGRESRDHALQRQGQEVAVRHSSGSPQEKQRGSSGPMSSESQGTSARKRVLSTPPSVRRTSMLASKSWFPRSSARPSSSGPRRSST